MSQDVAITTAKIGTVAGGSTTVVAGYLNNIPIAVYGLIATVVFGVLGLVVTTYFKNKEYKVRVAEFKATHGGRHPDSFLE